MNVLNIAATVEIRVVSVSTTSDSSDPTMLGIVTRVIVVFIGGVEIPKHNTCAKVCTRMPMAVIAPMTVPVVSVVVKAVDSCMPMRSVTQIGMLTIVRTMLGNMTLFSSIMRISHN